MGSCDICVSLMFIVIYIHVTIYTCLKSAILMAIETRYVARSGSCLNGSSPDCCFMQTLAGNAHFSYVLFTFLFHHIHIHKIFGHCLVIIFLLFIIL